MSVIPDQPDALLCNDPKVRGDALVILDGTKDGDADFNWNKCNTESDTTGYDFKHQDQRGFCHLIPGEEGKTEAKAIKAMMHELGYVMGLNHELQRNDRDDFIDFHCDRLDGYSKAVGDTKIDEKAMFNDEIKDAQRIILLCTDSTIAAAYLPAALSFVRLKDLSRGDASKDERRKWKYYASSKGFDYASIMIYDSYSGSPLGTNLDDKSKWVTTRKDGTALLQGGSADPAKAKISEGDIARIAQLYPKANGSSLAAQNLGEWGAKNKKLRVKVRGLEFVIEPPTKLEA